VAEVEEKRLIDAYEQAVKKVRHTAPISLGGLIAKARVAYFTHLNMDNHLAIVEDIIKMFWREKMTVPDFFLA
jgi:hypothetical protein